MLKALWNKLFGDNSNIEDRLIRLISLTISILLVPSLFANYFLGLPTSINVLVFILIVVYTSMYFYTSKYPITSLVKWVFIGIPIALIYPLWFLNGGLTGTATPYLFLMLFMGSIVLNKRSQSHLPIILLCSFFLLIILEYLYPEWVVKFESDTVYKWDMGIGLTCSLLACSGLIITFRLSYLKDHEKLVKVSDDLNQSNIKLKAAKEIAETASQTKSAFLAKMSHELRTPLNTIIGASDLLKKKELSEEQSELVHLMDDSSELLLNLISDILDLSKVEADRLEVKNAPMDLLKLTENMVDFAHFKIEATNKSIAITHSVGESVPKRIIADHLRLKQVITNLISNAVKYTPSGSIELELNAFADARDKEWLSFSIIDSGIGIPESQIEFIRQPFRQGTNASTEIGGAGLGLAICQSLATLMGGYMNIESTIGKGSVFTFTLPLRRHKLSNIPQKPEDKPVPQSLSSVRILVAEDNKINQIIIIKLLQSLSIKAELVSDGEQAWEKLKSNTYDIVLMDLHMPIMDGLTATEGILNDANISEKPVIIALTANAFKEDEERCKEAGMKGFLSKPITSERLEASIRGVLSETNASTDW